MLFDKTGGRLALVFELMSLNLYELIRGRRRHLASGLVKVYMFQTLRALAHMHEKGVMHRDIKPENVLVESSYDVYSGLKLADFGSCRGIYSRQPYTEYISTRWYRAPECLLTDGYYGREMDVWGVGSVFYELCALRPLFPGENEKDMVRRIHEVLGTPSDKTLQFLKRHASRHMDLNFAPVRGKGLASMIPGHVPVQMVDLLLKMLQYDPRRRITAKEALMHPYFADLRRTEVPAELKSKYPQAFDSPEVQPASAQSSKRSTSGKKASGGGGAGSKSGAAAASSTATVEGKEGESSKKRGADPSGGTKHHGHTSSTTSSGSGTGSTHHGSTTAQKQRLEEQARRRAKAASDKLARDLARAEAAKAAKAAKEADDAVAAVAAAVKPKHPSHGLEEEGVDSGSPNDRKKRSKRLYDGKGTVQPQTLKSTGQTSMFAAARARRGSVGDADEVVDEVNDGGGRQGADKHGGGGHGASHGGATHGQYGRSHHHQSAARMGAVGGQQPAVTRRPRGLRRRFGPGSSGAGGTGSSVGGAGGGVTGASVALSPSTTRTVAGGSSLRHGAHGAGQLSNSTSRIAQGARPLYGVGATGGATGASGAAGMSVMGSGGAGGGASSGLRSGAGAARRAVGRPYLGGGAGGGVSGYGGGSSAARRAARYGGGGAVSAARRRQGGVTGGGYGASSGGGFSYGGAGRAAGAGWRRR